MTAWEILNNAVVLILATLQVLGAISPLVALALGVAWKAYAWNARRKDGLKEMPAPWDPEKGTGPLSQPIPLDQKPPETWQ